MMGDKIVELVKFWKEENYNYGFYTTSPEPYYSKLKNKLIDAGIKNWSSGLDYIHEVYIKKKCCTFTDNLVSDQQDVLIQKSKDSLKGLIEMSSFVKETHALITISKMNIEYVPEMIVYLVDHIKNIHVGLNFIEYSVEDQMDFATLKEGKFFFKETDAYLFDDLKANILKLKDKYKNRIQTPLEYLDQTDHILNLNYHCKLQSMALGIDTDGTLRLCGYKTLDKNISVFELEKNYEEIEKIIIDNWKRCSGCYWAYPYILDIHGESGINYDSLFWKKRTSEKND